jgi:predicted GH43/DUF377 family glycosyl hydrolase
MTISFSQNPSFSAPPTRRELLRAGAGALAGFLLPLDSGGTSGTLLPQNWGPEGNRKARPMNIPALLARVRTPHKQPALILAPSYKKGEFDSHAVDGPFVFRHGRRFFMTFIGFDGIGYRTGLASSEDLIHWKKEGLLLDRGPKGSVTEFNVALTWILRENDLFGAGRLRKVHGSYLGTYHAYPKPGYESGPAAIGLCRSDDLKNWRLEDPCLRAADGGEWERAGLYKSCLLESAGTYYLFYNAKNREGGWIEQTGFATSKDLKKWSRFEGNPVLKVGPKGSFDDTFASDPCVLKAGDAWALFYYTLSSADGHARDSAAFSRDLREWTKSGEILIDVGEKGAIDSQYAHKPSLFSHRGRVYHYYCAVAPNPAGRVGEIETGEIRGIGLATS